MSALSGQVIMTLRDNVGATLIQVTINFNPATNALVDAAVPTSSGSKTGALVADNLTGRLQHVVVADAAGNVSRTVNVPAGGSTITAAQFAALTPPVTTQSQLNGLTFSLA